MMPRSSRGPRRARRPRSGSRSGHGARRWPGRGDAEPADRARQRGTFEGPERPDVTAPAAERMATFDDFGRRFIAVMEDRVAILERSGPSPAPRLPEPPGADPPPGSASPTTRPRPRNVSSPERGRPRPPPLALIERIPAPRVGATALDRTTYHLIWSRLGSERRQLLMEGDIRRAV
jgi:hypothetical protein